MNIQNTLMPNERLLSLDFFRGLTMSFLVLEGTEFYGYVREATSEGSFFNSLILQFHHHPWNGLRFWDLIQPYFMFIVGVAMVFSINKRLSKGVAKSEITKHILIRSVTLFFFGVILHCGYSQKLVWELWNVLTQLGFTILISYAIFNLRIRYQFIITILILFLTEILYRYSNIEGFNQPFEIGRNFGSWMDLILMNKINDGGWVVINFLPTSAHTIWGVIAGKILFSKKENLDKFKIIAIAGIIGIVAGYSLDFLGITPIIKRICTSSFVIVSGGWSLLTLAIFYYLVDLKSFNKGMTIFVVVGMNPIFIYMFSQTLGGQWFNEFVNIFVSGFAQYLSVHQEISNIINSLVVFSIELYLCYWLFKKKIFFKI
ncbi:MAG: DUF5009 domain-containing protein [Ignavibacteriae bacterium]|nr:DUF5009 domain-containing protein [Ignavibacteriota bacterium]